MLLGELCLPAAALSGSSFQGRLPLCFEANHGQVPGTGRFLARNQQALFWFSPAETIITLRREAVSGRPAIGSARDTQTSTVHLRFLGGDPGAAMIGLGELPGTINYLVGNDAAHWRTHVPTFQKVAIQNVYPGIDVVQYGNQRQLEYDFVVAPGADPGRIALQVSGADALEIDPQGDLLLKIGASQIRQSKPVLYQMDHNRRRPIEGGYALKDDQTVVFQIGSYDKALPLILDPILGYSTFLGGLGNDVGRAIAIDNGGNIWIAGDTLSTQLGTPNAFQPQLAIGYPGAGGDAFVAKFDATGTNLLFLTYLGGSGDDAATSVALDAAGNGYISGVTDSTNFPIASLTLSNHISGQGELYFGLHQYDAFVAKLSPDGSQLIYSTYLGGRALDEALGIAVDQNACAYVVGFTQSKDFPTTPNAFQTNFQGGTDAFVTKIASNGTSLVYSTFLGGTNTDQAQSIALDTLGRAYITGSTLSTNFPVLTNAFQSSGPTNPLVSQVFVSILASNGMALTQSTLIGGLGNALGFHIAVDPAGHVFVTGTENGPGFPVTPGKINPGGVFKSGDAAADWTASNFGLLHNQVRAIGIDPVNPSNLYAGTGRGIVLSTNAGASWQVSLNTFDQVATFAIDPGQPSTIYAGSTEVLKSTNAGASWFPSSTGLVSSAKAPTNTFVTINKLVVDPVTPSILYAATISGVFKTTDAAALWRRTSSGLGNLTVNDLIIDPSNPTNLYAATTSGVFRSTNSGSLWRPFKEGLTNLLADALAIDSSPIPNLYLGLADGSLFKRPATATNWFLLSNGLIATNSISTNTIPFGSVTLLAVDPASLSTVYAGTRGGLFKSTDAGTNWFIVTNGLPNLPISALAIDPLSPSTLYVGLFNFFAGIDAFVTKFNADLSSLSYSVLLSGSGTDQGIGLALDSAGDAFVAGSTTSGDFPVLNAIDYPSTFNSGSSDAFVAAVNPDGSDFLFSTYLGGFGNDFGNGIALDSANDVWVVGQTASPEFPIVGGTQCCLGAPSDAFLAKLSFTTNALVDVTLDTIPSGIALFVDGTTNGTPITFHWPIGSFHSVVALPQSAGTNVQYAWTAWSDGGPFFHNIPARANTNLTASFKLQYFLTMASTNITVTDTNLAINATNSGLVVPVSGWYDAGTNVTISAQPPVGNTFAGWLGTGAGSFTGTNNPVDLVLNGPISETATFSGPLTNRLSVLINGSGTVSPSYNGHSLKVGTVYTVNASASVGSVFSSWLVGGVEVFTPKLSFLMTNGLVLQANFVPSPFNPVAGTYAGLFYDTNLIVFDSSGFFSATVTGGGRLSARVQSSGRTYGFSGQFPAQGFLSVTVPRLGLPSLIVTLQLDYTGTNNFLLTGLINGGPWTAELTANRAVFSTTNPPALAGNKYTLVFPGPPGSLSEPGGDGFGTASIDAAGNISFNGTLGDGTAVAQRTFLSGQGQWPFFVSLYGGNGLIFGWITFADQPETDLTGLVNWFKLARPFTSLYPSGFSIQSEALGSLYSFTNGMPILPLNQGQGQLILENGTLEQPIINYFTVNAANQVTSTNKMSLSFTTSSGLFRGSALDPATARTVSFKGAVLQKANQGGGVFRLSNQTGSARIESP